ncbi:unnamed protein product [Amoebophrya sp. A25]|nr:unnamed protein product [Amoebophrya sp. A25]|eukprot:GSA25T00013671001.1
MLVRVVHNCAGQHGSVLGRQFFSRVPATSAAASATGATAHSVRMYTTGSGSSSSSNSAEVRGGNQQRRASSTSASAATALSATNRPPDVLPGTSASSCSSSAPSTTGDVATAPAKTYTAPRGKPKMRLPEYAKMQSIHRSPEATEAFSETKATLKELGLATVCQSAKCPNLNECWGGGTATIMILGDTCTRACRFCSVKTSKRPEGIGEGSKLHDEPAKVAEAISKWDHLRYVVITCVDRDDLMDFGAVHIKRTVQNVKKIRRRRIVPEDVAHLLDSPTALEGPVPSGSLSREDLLGGGATLSGHDNPLSPSSSTSTGAAARIDGATAADEEVLVETLLGDFRGELKLVDIVLDGNMDVFAHNIETVDRLNSLVRDRRANYKQSLSVLEHVANQNDKRLRQGKNAIITKSSIIVGLGETDQEIEQTMRDLHSAGCRAVTLGQYLQPTKGHMRVDRFASKDKFDEYGDLARSIGFDMVASGPMVRSSYKAGELYLTRMIEKDRRSLAQAL